MNFPTKRTHANGAHPKGLATRTISLTDRELNEDDEPVDLVALQADDELINALAAGLSVSAASGRGPDADDRVSAILAAWKAEVDAEPIPELVDTDTAVATVLAARRPSGRARHLVPIAAAAMAIVTLIGGVSVGSYSAEPDSALWPVAKVLYSGKTTSVEAAARAEQRIARAKQAIAAGQPAVAEHELQAAAVDLAVVRPEEGRAELVDVQSFLVAKAEETLPGVPTDPGAPLAADQARKVPPGAAMSSPARTSEQTSPTTTPADESSSSTPGGETSTDTSPVAPVAPQPIDPRIANVDPQTDPVAPAAPAEEPSVSTAPSSGAGTPPQVEGSEDATGTSPAPPAPETSQSPAGPEAAVGGPAAAPESITTVAPDGTQSVGATASDTSSTAASPTS